MFVSKTETFVKLFFVLSLFGLLMYSVLAFYTFHTALSSLNKTQKNKNKKVTVDMTERFDDDLKYILIWTSDEFSYNLTKKGQKVFISNKCPQYNCYLTTDKYLLNNDIRNFDSIIFQKDSLAHWLKNMPKNRSLTQKYVFASMKPAESNPVCHVNADDFFNWTWTYKLYSDIVQPFFEVLDLNGTVVAPKSKVDWIEKENWKPNANIVKKSKAVMFYIKNCSDKQDKVKFAKDLKGALKEHLLNMDIFGCNYRRCLNDSCLNMLSTDYYFYLVYEPSVTEDFVTTEVLVAYDNNVVPIIKGGADYKKFLPTGSYISINHGQPDQLASNIAYALKTPSIYNNYFSWKKYYTIRKVPLERGYCKLCELLNNKKKVTEPSMYLTFRKWWYYGSLKDICIPKGAEKFDEVFSYVKEKVKVPKIR